MKIKTTIFAKRRNRVNPIGRISTVEKYDRNLAIKLRNTLVRLFPKMHFFTISHVDLDENPNHRKVFYTDNGKQYFLETNSVTGERYRRYLKEENYETLNITAADTSITFSKQSKRKKRPTG